MFSVVTEQGTAMSEATLCLTHYLEPTAKELAEWAAESAEDVGLPIQWGVSSGNEEVACIECGSED